MKSTTRYSSQRKCSGWRLSLIDRITTGKTFQGESMSGSSSAMQNKDKQENDDDDESFYKIIGKPARTTSSASESSAVRHSPYREPSAISGQGGWRTRSCVCDCSSV